MSTPIQIQFRDDNIVITIIETSDKPFERESNDHLITFDQGYKNVFEVIASALKPKFYQRTTKYYIMSNGNHFTTIMYD